jgi:hypothetical protein
MKSSILQRYISVCNTATKTHIVKHYHNELSSKKCIRENEKTPVRIATQLTTLIISRSETPCHRSVRNFPDIRQYLHKLQGGMENHTSNSKYHIRNVQDTEAFLKTLAESIH